jgi:hypothetical protein
MAYEESARTFSTRPSGGGRNPYADAFLSSFSKQADAKADRSEVKDIVDVAKFLQSEDKDARAERRLELSQEIEARRQRMAEQELEFKMKSQERADRAEQRRLAREEQKQELLDEADALSFKIESINPMNKNAGQELERIRKMGSFNFFIANRDTRQAVTESLDNKIRQMSEIKQGIQHEGRSKYDVDVDISKFPTDKEGNYDFEKGYNEYLPVLGEQFKQMKEQARIAEERALFEKARSYDPMGTKLGVAGVTKEGPIIKMGAEDQKVIALSEAVPKYFSDEAKTGLEMKDVSTQQIGMKPSSFGETKPSGFPAPSPLPSATPQVTTEEQPARKPLGEIF